MEAPCQFLPMPAGAGDIEALPVATQNNLCALQLRNRYAELQNWVRGRAR